MTNEPSGRSGSVSRVGIAQGVVTQVGGDSGYLRTLRGLDGKINVSSSSSFTATARRVMEAV
jgi:hypothetical protein